MRKAKPSSGTLSSRFAYHLPLYLYLGVQALTEYVNLSQGAEPSSNIIIISLS